MRKLIFILFTILLVSCEKEGELTKSNTGNSVSNQSVLKYKANFIPTAGINVSGTANVYLDNGKYKLGLENVVISSGPDLKVYLSKSDSPNDYVNLGNFQGNGTSYYVIPNGISFSEYKYVLIHCQQYNHLFAIGQLNSI
ncbi:MAG: DM13 domain-containing protein [Limnohabitans sp.]|nr:DM13 domain-containing protein [Limnohabitans sp.]